MYNGPNIVTDGLVLHLDAANNKSYASQNLEVDVLVVGGGGGGSSESLDNGGAGAGGLIFKENLFITTQPYTVSVGSGGNIGQPGQNGQNSVFDNLVALGGAGGPNINNPGRDGGSGSGASEDGPNNTGGSGLQPDSVSGGFGNDGGKQNTDSNNNHGAGGGGAGAPGQDATSSRVGNGGDGLYYGDYFGNNFGENGFFAGGGGGGGQDNSRGFGGKGGGGNGVTGIGGSRNGQQNTGGGGGGGANNPDSGGKAPGGSGGSGIVLIRYKGPQKATGGTITHFNGYTIHAFTSSGIFSVGDFIGDISGNNNSGQLINEPTFVSNNLGSLVFDGVNNAINTELLFDKDDFTYSAWFKWNGSSSQSSQNIIDSIDNNSQEWARIMIWNSTGEFWFVIDNDGFKINGQTGVFIDTNKWYYGVGVWTRSTGLMEAYINGDKVFETTHPNKSTIFAVNSENIGSRSKSNKEFFNGEIPNVQIYNKALTAEEVLQNYNATKSRFRL
jgi:hypothetical protein